VTSFPTNPQKSSSAIPRFPRLRELRAGVGSAAAKIDNLCRLPIAKTAALSWPGRIALNADRRQSIIAARFGT